MALSGSLNFITASQYGSSGPAYSPSERGMLSSPPGNTTAASLGSPSSAQGATFIPVDFVGLNINVKEPVTASQNLLGHAQGVGLFEDRSSISDDDGNLVISVAHNAGAYNPKPGSGSFAPFIKYVDATMFNALMLHRNGPYGFPTWKQVRVGEHPVARYLRTHNTTSFSTQHSQYPKKRYDFSFDNPPPVFIDPENPTGDDFKKWGHNVRMSAVLEGEVYYPINSSYYEPVVVSRHKPVEIYIKGTSLDNNPMEAVGRYTVLNNISYFTNWGANKNLNIRNIETGSTKNIEFRQTLSTFYSDPDTNNMEFTETIFPREVNTYRGLTRDRQNYAESAGTGQFDNVYDKRMHRTFWRDNSENRARTDATSLNSQNYAQRFGFDATKPPGGTSNGTDGQLTDGAMLLNAGFYFNHGSSSYVTNGVVTDQIRSYDPKTAVGTQATATIVTVAEASLVDTKDFTLTNAAGVTISFNFSGGQPTSRNTESYDATSNITVDIGYSDLASGDPGATGDQIVARINAGTGIDMVAAKSGDNVVVTQGRGGTQGNKTNTDEGTGLTVGNFTGGTDYTIAERALSYPVSQEASTSFKVQPTQLEYMQPYPIICNSVWPLEPRKDIYQKPAYLAGIENSGSDAAGLNSSVSIGLSPLAPATTFSSRSFAEAITASISRSAGELVYSTKPTIFYYKQATEKV